MDQPLREQICTLAGDACEYCRLPQSASPLLFVLDHVIARQHGGGDTIDNRALCCGRGNRHQGPNIAGVDPESRQMTRLFHPRVDTWSEHFRWEGAVLVGLTPVGRATIVVLALNHPSQIAVRESLQQEGA